MREHFEDWNPKRTALLIAKTANEIIAEYQAQNLTLTLRQLYYQFVSRDLLPNTEKSYKNLGTTIARARVAGLLDWDAIEDRARRPVIWGENATAKEAVEEALKHFRLPRLRGQSTYVELWVEKDALAGVLQPIAARYHVTLMVNRGYSSVSAMKAAADRIRERCEFYDTDCAEVLYLGDLDPSGEDMVRDVTTRLEMFINTGHLVESDPFEDAPDVEDDDDQANRKWFINLGVKKIALTMEQVRKHKPPPNPAKVTDSRAAAYIAKFGNSSWEVDALPPTALRDVIEGALQRVLDIDVLNATIADEKRERELIIAAVESAWKEET